MAWDSCPQCKSKMLHDWDNPDIYRCYSLQTCSSSICYSKKWLWRQFITKQNPNATFTSGAPMKKAQIQYTYNKTIVDIYFCTVPKKGWVAENLKPVLELIKVLVPATSRSYDPHTFHWEIAVEYWTPISTILAQKGWFIEESKSQDTPKVHVDKQYEENFYHEPEPAPKEAPASVAAQLSVFLGVEITTQDLNELKKLYRREAMRLHPDMGGDASKMAELNRLWTLFAAKGSVQ